MNQYWLKVKYEDGYERWELTRGKFASVEALFEWAAEGFKKATHFTITEVKVHEQFEFELED